MVFTLSCLRVAWLELPQEIPQHVGYSYGGPRCLVEDSVPSNNVIGPLKEFTSSLYTLHSDLIVHYIIQEHVQPL